MPKTANLLSKISWMKRFCRAGTVTGKALTLFFRELHEQGDQRAIKELSDALGWRLTDKDIVEVCEHRARIEGDGVVGFRVVPNEQN